MPQYHLWLYGKTWHHEMEMLCSSLVLCEENWLATAVLLWPNAEVFPQGITHWGMGAHICVIILGHHWIGQYFVTCLAPHWLIINWTLGNILWWNSNKIQQFSWQKIQNGSHFILTSMCQKQYELLSPIATITDTTSNPCWLMISQHAPVQPSNIHPSTFRT